MPLFSTLAQVARSVSASYAIIYLLTLYAVFAAICLGLSATVEGPLRWALFALGSIIGLAAMGFSALVALRRPALLRHENVELIHRTLDIIGDDGRSSDIRLAVGSTMVKLLPHERESHKPSSIPTSEEDGRHE